MEITNKIYKPDYSFIVKNYMDKSMWGKQYLIYEYLDVKIFIYLNKINCMDNTLEFEIKITHDFDFEERSTTDEALYPRAVIFKINHPEYTIKILIKKINSIIRKILMDHFGKMNYYPKYIFLIEYYFEKLNIFYDENLDKFENEYDKMDDSIKNIISVDEIIEQNFDLEVKYPRITNFTEEHYIKEISIFDEAIKKSGGEYED